MKILKTTINGSFPRSCLLCAKYFAFFHLFIPHWQGQSQHYAVMDEKAKVGEGMVCQGHKAHEGHSWD